MSALLRNTLNSSVVSFLWPEVYTRVTLFLNMTSPIDIWYSIRASIDAHFLDNENCPISQRNRLWSSLKNHTILRPIAEKTSGWGTNSLWPRWDPVNAESPLVLVSTINCVHISEFVSYNFLCNPYCPDQVSGLLQCVTAVCEKGAEDNPVLTKNRFGLLQQKLSQ